VMGTAVSLPALALALTPRAPAVIPANLVALPAIAISLTPRAPTIVAEISLSLPALAITLTPQLPVVSIFVPVSVLLHPPVLPLEITPHPFSLTFGSVPKAIVMHVDSLHSPMLVRATMAVPGVTDHTLTLPTLSGANLT
jgi:hypothetical protein